MPTYRTMPCSMGCDRPGHGCSRRTEPVVCMSDPSGRQARPAPVGMDALQSARARCFVLLAYSIRRTSGEPRLDTTCVRSRTAIVRRTSAAPNDKCENARLTSHAMRAPRRSDVVAVRCSGHGHLRDRRRRPRLPRQSTSPTPHPAARELLPNLVVVLEQAPKSGDAALRIATERRSYRLNRRLTRPPEAARRPGVCILGYTRPGLN